MTMGDEEAGKQAQVGFSTPCHYLNYCTVRPTSKSSKQGMSKWAASLCDCAQQEHSNVLVPHAVDKLLVVATLRRRQSLDCDRWASARRSFETALGGHFPVPACLPRNLEVPNLRQSLDFVRSVPGLWLGEKGPPASALRGPET